MTELEFSLSLPQNLTPDEKDERLRAWRAENPQPEVEEVEEVESTPEQNQVDVLYARYNPALKRSAFMSDEEEDLYNQAANATNEEKVAWLNANTRTDQSYADVDTSGGYDAFADMITFGIFDFDEEAERAEQMQQDKELLKFQYDQENKNFLEATKKISEDPNLTTQQKLEAQSKIKPAPLIEEFDEEVVIQNIEDEWRDNSVTWSTMNEEDVRARFDSDEDFNNYKKFMEIEDNLESLTSSLRGMTNQKTGMPYGNMKTKYDQTLTKINELRSQRGELIAPYNESKSKKADKTKENIIGSGKTRIEVRKASKVSEPALQKALTYLPDDFSGISNQDDLDNTMKESYREFVMNDEILSTAWDSIQKAAAADIKKYENELLASNKYDLTTKEGVDAANADLEAYARSITLDKFEGSNLYKQRLTDLGTVMDRAMSQTSTAYQRSQNYFLSRTDALRGSENDFIPFNDTLANLIEGVAKGGLNIYSSGKKALASVEAKGVRIAQREIDKINERVRSGEISAEEGEKLKNKEYVDGGKIMTPLLELMEQKKDVENLFDSIKEDEQLTSLFKSADLSDGISFQDAVFVTAEALPQIGLAVGGTLTGNPVLAGLGTAAMFTQMYGDNYWSAYQEGIQKDAKAMGIDLNSMTPEERRAFEIKALEEGKHANMATSAAFAGVMTLAEQIGANKILSKTEEALGLGKGGLVSFYKGSWKDSGEALLRSALRKGEAGLTEFATEFSQEVLGQISTGLQGGGSMTEQLDWGASLEAGKAGGVVGVMIPFASSVATQTAVEIRNVSRDVAIKFAPDSKYGKFAIEVEKYFDSAQTNLDTKLANEQITEAEYKEESQTLADTRNAGLKIDANADQSVRTRQLDLMVERNKLQREIKQIDDSDLTVEQEARLKEVKKQLRDVVAEQKLYNTSGNVRKIISDVGPKDSDGNPMIEFRDVQSAKEAQEIADQLEKEGYTKAAASNSHGVQMVNEKTGKEVLLINNEVAAGKSGFVGNVNVGAHEFLHSVLKKTLDANPEVATEMQTEMNKYLQSIDVEGIDLDSEYGQNLMQYLDKPSTEFSEEALILFADGLARGDIQLNEGAIQGFKDMLRRLLQSMGIKNIRFNEGKDVVNFLKDYNKSIEKGKLNRAQRKLLEGSAEGEIVTRASRRGIATGQTNRESRARELRELADPYMETPNNILQQGLISELSQNKENKAVAIPLAQALLEKNWPLISKNLNINSEAEMDAAKRIVLDQLIGEFKGSGVVETGSIKYPPRNTSALQGFSLDPEGGSAAAQVSTYMQETFSKRKPEIDAAIVDEVKAGIEVNPDITGGTVTQVETAEVETTKPTPSETTTYSDEILQRVNTDKAGLETRITEAVQESYPGRTDVKLAETRNIPKEVAEVYTEMLGITNPNRLTDKSQTFSVTDEAGLRNAKVFLDKNAQADFNRLPEALDASGKGTFIPLNVKKALYTDGKKTGTLKDYKDLIKIPQTKKIYRDSAKVGTIRGLLSLHIRNRILETGNPDPASRKAGGAKFSKARKTPKTSKRSTARTEVKIQPQKTIDQINPENVSKIMELRDIAKVRESLKIKSDVTVNDSNRKARQADMLKTIEKGKIPGPMFDKLQLANFGRKMAYGNRNRKFPTRAKAIEAGIANPIQYAVTTDGQYFNTKTKGGKLSARTDWAARKGDLYYGKSDPAYKEAKAVANANNDLYDASNVDNFNNVQRITIPKGTRINRNTKLDNGRTVAEQEKINMDALKFMNKVINDGVQNKTIPMNDAALMISSAYQSSNGILKIAIPFTAVSNKFEAAEGGKRKSKGKGAIEEHSPPVSSLGAAMLWGYKNNASDIIMDAIEANAVQVQLSNKSDYLLDKAGLDAKIPEGTSIFTPNVGFVRLAAAGINLNTITDLKTGKPIAEIMGLPLPESEWNNPESVNYQNELLLKVAQDSDFDINQAKTRLKKSIPVQQAKNSRAREFAKGIGTPIVTENMTSEQQKNVMINSLKTKENAAKINPEQKGISVFDFDDTLAKTKEKVIVTDRDGKVTEISAAEFAREAGNLTEAGATFDFSNFEKVAADTKQGPLADLARKRQGKFGSGDIFVLTARPNAAGPAIQQFLKSIGINIPLKNITGLEDGSPQAKVDWVLNKTAEGYNDFYFADDSFANVEAVKQVLDAVDVKNDVQQAKESKARKLNEDFNKQIEEVTGVGKFKQYSTARARLEGKKKDGGFIKRFARQFTITPSADDFLGLMYAIVGKGEQGNKHLKFIKDNLVDVYDRAEQQLLSAKVSVARDFAALRSKFPTLKGSKLSFANPLLKEIDGGPFNKEQAVRVYIWNKQGMEIPDMSKRDINRLVKAVEADPELNIFADELQLIQKSKDYPAPGKNWLGGSIKNDILDGLDTSFRAQLMKEFNENADAIFTPEMFNKLEAIYGSKYVEALKDSLRRMKSGNNRPVIVGAGASLVNEMLDWLNASVANVMFLNMRSGLLQTLSTVNFINWGDNNIYNAAKAFASKEMWPTFMRLMNSDYLVNRRDGLKINVNEAELADAAKKGGIKGAFSYLLDKGFAITRIMDSFAIALGGSTFFINRKKALLKRVNEKTGELYTEAEADQQAFEDFYQVAEETQQSSNPSKISSQQASFAGRILLSFQNVTMQFNRKTKKSIQDLYNRRKKPGMTQRESDLSNLSSIIYYVGIQNVMFNALQQAIFALAFEDDEEEQNLTKKERVANIANGMTDSLLFGLGFGGAIVATTKNILMRIADETTKKKPDYRDIPDDVFDVSSVVDAKYRKLKTAARTFTFNRKEIKERGWSLDNPAYLAVAQIISAATNAPIDRVLQKVNNLRQASDESTRMWQRVALVMGWNGWNFGLPYWGRQSTIDQENKDAEKVKENYEKKVKEIKSKGFTKKIPLSGPNHYKPTGKLGVDYVQVERPSGEIQYYIKP